MADIDADPHDIDGGILGLAGERLSFACEGIDTYVRERAVGKTYSWIWLPELLVFPRRPANQDDNPVIDASFQYPKMASGSVPRRWICRRGKRGLVPCGQVRNFVRPSNPAVSDLNGMNSHALSCQLRGERRASNNRLRVRRPQLNLISAQFSQPGMFSSEL